MRVNYLGPLCVGIQHPALAGYDLSQFSPSCFLVEVGDEAGVSGPVIKGDLLVVDEARAPGHADLVVVEQAGEQRLFTTHRIGGQNRLLPVSARAVSRSRRRRGR